MVSIAIRYFAHARREHEANVVQSAGIQDINITMQFSDLLLSRTPCLGQFLIGPLVFLLVDRQHNYKSSVFTAMSNCGRTGRNQGHL